MVVISFVSYLFFSSSKAKSPRQSYSQFQPASISGLRLADTIGQSSQRFQSFCFTPRLCYRVNLGYPFPNFFRGHCYSDARGLSVNHPMKQCPAMICASFSFFGAHLQNLIFLLPSTATMVTSHSCGPLVRLIMYSPPVAKWSICLANCTMRGDRSAGGGIGCVGSVTVSTKSGVGVVVTVLGSMSILPNIFDFDRQCYFLDDCPFVSVVSAKIHAAIYGLLCTFRARPRGGQKSTRLFIATQKNKRRFGTVQLPMAARNRIHRNIDAFDCG